MKQPLLISLKGAICIALAFSAFPATVIMLKKSGPPKQKWPSTNTLTLDIDSEAFKSYNYSNFYRLRDIVRDIDSELKKCGASNVAMRFDFYLYTFSKQPDGKVNVIYRP